MKADHFDRKRAAEEAWVRLSLTPDWSVVVAFFEDLRRLDIAAVSQPGLSDIDRALAAGHLRAVQDVLSRPDVAIARLSRNPLTSSAPDDQYEPPPNTNPPLGRTG